MTATKHLPLRASRIAAVGWLCGLLMSACSSSDDNRTDGGRMAASGGGGGHAGDGPIGTAGISGAAGGAAGTSVTASCTEGLVPRALNQERMVPDPIPWSCSYLLVDVIVDGATGRDQRKMQQVSSVAVTAEGAISGAGQFLLSDFPRPDGYLYRTVSAGQIVLAEFEYGTTSEPGKVTFRIDVRDGLLNTLASGSNEGTIQPGGAVAMSVTVEPAATW